MRTVFLRFLIGCLILVISPPASAQKDQTLFFGINVGTKLANKHYAVRYSGLYQNELYNTVMSNPYNYNQIYIGLGDKNFYIPYDAYPGNIHYSPGILTGVTAGYQVTPNFQMSIDANFSKLKVKDYFTIVVEDPTNYTTEPTIRVGELYGQEGRFDGRFNLDYVFDGDKARFMMGVSGIFNAWRIEQQTAIIANYTMSLFSVHNPTNNFTNKVSGMGWGGGLNIGFEYRINEKMVTQVLYQPYQTKVDYGISTGKTLLIQHDITARILWK